MYENVLSHSTETSCTKRKELEDVFANYVGRTPNTIIMYLCCRCRTHLASKKTFCPLNAYWNNLDPGEIPAELLLLSQAERSTIYEDYQVIAKM